METTVDEQILVQKCQKGDTEAFRQIVEMYKERLYFVCYGIVSNPDDALDLSQEAMIRAYRSIGKFRSGSKLYTWLYRIAVNVSLDFIRKSRRKKEIAFDPNIKIDPEQGGELLSRKNHQKGPDQVVQDQELMDLIMKSIDELSPDHKAVITLRELNGLDYQEIAQVMKTRVGTVMSRLHYARQQVRVKVKEYFGDSYNEKT